MSGPLAILAAGSLRRALPELAPPGARLRFGPAGQLRRDIEAGAPCDLFLSANLAHPEALAARRPGADVVCFATNGVVALARPDLAMTPERFLDVLLDPTVRLGTSTPGADPGGDYALALFARAGQIRPGSEQILAEKAHHLVGGWGTLPTPPLVSLLDENQVDVFLCYHTTALALGEKLDGKFQPVPPPEPLRILARYAGVILAKTPDSQRDSATLLARLRSRDGQAILARYGFGSPA